MSDVVGKYYTVSCASSVTLSSAADLQIAYRRVYLKVPTMTSGTDLCLQGSHDGVTYCRIYHPSVQSSSVQTPLYQIPSSVTQAIVPIPDGFRYLKVEQISAMTANGAAFVIIASD